MTVIGQRSSLFENSREIDRPDAIISAVSKNQLTKNTTQTANIRIGQSGSGKVAKKKNMVTNGNAITAANAKPAYLKTCPFTPLLPHRRHVMPQQPQHIGGAFQDVAPRIAMPCLPCHATHAKHLP
jgi:hypothetical protein